MVHKLKGHYLDTKHPIIVENLMGIRRVKGSIQKGKKPLLINHLKSIINIIDQQKTEEIKKHRDKSIILIGFGGGFRRTELISICLLYTSPSPRDQRGSRMPSSA